MQSHLVGTVPDALVASIPVQITIDRTPPPFFRQGPSALTRLTFFSALALFLMVADTRFQLTKPLRAAIASVPYGETMTYGALARAHDSGARAVGGACARNPYPIVIPCHRVIATGGGLGGYAYGLDIKRALLDRERDRKK